MEVLEGVGPCPEVGVGWFVFGYVDVVGQLYNSRVAIGQGVEFLAQVLWVFVWFVSNIAHNVCRQEVCRLSVGVRVVKESGDVL